VRIRIYAMRGVKQYRKLPTGSFIIILMAAATLRGFSTKSRLSWMRWCHAPNRFGTVNMEDNINIK